jgi:hypothetical protein
VLGAKASGGHVALVPEQLSATSQMLTAGRQTVVLGAKASGGHVALVPEQLSATSQMLTAGRQTVVLGAKASGGQSALVPEQVSATSHRSTEGRQTVLGGWNPSGGQTPPEQVSATSHTPAATRQTFPTVGVPTQTRSALQMSFVVQTLPSSQDCPGAGFCWQVPCLMHRPGRSQPGGKGQVAAWQATVGHESSPGVRTHCLTGFPPSTNPQVPFPPGPHASTVQLLPSPTY